MIVYVSHTPPVVKYLLIIELVCINRLVRDTLRAAIVSSDSLTSVRSFASNDTASPFTSFYYVKSNKYNDD